MSGRLPAKTLWLLGLTLVVSLATIAATLLLDPNRFRDQLTEAVRDLTGRELFLGGDLGLSWSLNPTLEARDVGLANADWAAGRDMLHVGRLAVQVALVPLFSGKVRINAIRLEDATLRVQSGPAGQSNWALQTTGSGAGGALPEIDRVSVTRFKLLYQGRKGPADAWTADRLDGRPQILQQGVSVRDLHLETGGSTYRGELTYSADDTAQHLSGNLSVDAVRLAQEDAKPGRPRQDTSGKLFSNRPLASHLPSDLQTDVSVHIGKLSLDGLNLEKLAFRLRTSNGVLELDDASAKLAGGTVSARFTLDTSAKALRSTLLLKGRQLNVGTLLQSRKGHRWLQARGDLSLNVQGHGKSLAAIMGTLKGTARWSIGKGRAQLGEVDSVVGGLRTALGSLLSKGAESARLNCSLGDFKIAKGVAVSQVLLADAQDSTVYGEGQINLGTERLSLLLTPKPKSATLNVAVPVKVGGSLRAPTFTPEKLATARKAGGLLAAVGIIAFPPAALLGLGELGSDDNPCLAIAAQGKMAPGKGKSDKLLQRASEGVGKAVEGVGNAIKGLFE
jgi:uncharacterized protein involved in outer membrane biogenesis